MSLSWLIQEPRQLLLSIMPVSKAAVRAGAAGFPSLSQITTRQKYLAKGSRGPPWYTTLLAEELIFPVFQVIAIAPRFADGEEDVDIPFSVIRLISPESS